MAKPKTITVNNINLDVTIEDDEILEISFKGINITTLLDTLFTADTVDNAIRAAMVEGKNVS